MKIHVTSVFVDDQAKALSFYTDVLGFLPGKDIPVGEYRWLTVVPSDGPQDVELLLEPNQHAAARAYQEGIYADGIPATSFQVDDLRAEYERLSKQGVSFTKEPTEFPFGSIAVLDDTCGNLIQLLQPA
jgi:catechol 2,3-dioxygenase-like lactoylglutathione lyase family enzyme